MCEEKHQRTWETFASIAEDMGTSIAMIDLTYSHVPRALQQSGADRLAGMLYGT
jgi:hypothetical protein